MPKQVGEDSDYTVETGPQDDRGLMFDFFSQIKTWAATYTVYAPLLSAMKVQSVIMRPIFAAVIGKHAQPMGLVMEKEGLVSLVAAAISRHLITHTMDEFALSRSRHPDSVNCEKSAFCWQLHAPSEIAAKQDVLLSQKEAYTTLNKAPGHAAWRQATALRHTNELLPDLADLLITNLSPNAIAERNRILIKLYMKGFRVNFRLRMSATWFDFSWPAVGADFDPQKMVMENRCLYGSIVRTMKAVMSSPTSHEVVFAVSPTITKQTYDKNLLETEVVHSAMVHIAKKTVDGRAGVGV